MSLTPNITDKDFWAIRAKKYKKLEWANKSEYLNCFVKAGSFDANDVVLDVGAGTGIIAHTIAPFVKKLVGIDISEDMLVQAQQEGFENIEWRVMDTHELAFKDETFDKVTARMVFHHIIYDTGRAMDECYRVLKRGGTMIFSEGVPPSSHVVPFYTEMFRLKEERITFMDDDLVDLIAQAGFKNIKKEIIWSRQASIRNWLENSGLPDETQSIIFQMHLDLDEQGKRDYNMTIKNNDCFIDMKFVILTGEK